jgi:hypothetical protein
VITWPPFSSSRIVMVCTMNRCFLAILALSCVLATGCATSVTIKDASTKHASNLMGLQQAVGEYRKKLDAYFDRLIAQQREAHIAMHVDRGIHNQAETQAASIAEKMSPSQSDPKDLAAADFIKAGATVGNAFVYFRDNFDRWVEKTEGKDLEERRKALEKKLGAPIKDNEDDLTFVKVAIDLKQQRKNLDDQLNLLTAQVTTMQAFHEKINEFLSIDATIDGGKIAAAAAAGSKGDLAGILGKK